MCVVLSLSLSDKNTALLFVFILKFWLGSELELVTFAFSRPNEKKTPRETVDRVPV